MELRVKLTDGAPLPRHAKPGDAGLDLSTMEAFDIFPGQTVMVHTGVYAEIPDGYYGAVVPRSGIAAKRMLAPINSPGTIDSHYRGEILVPLHNFAPYLVIGDSNTNLDCMVNRHAVQHVEAGERIAQLIISKYETCECVEVDELSDTERGATGFGSSGTTEVVE